MITIHTGEIELMLCEEAHFHEDYENKIKNIPIIGAKVKIYDKDKKTLLYDNTANDQGKIEISNSEIKDEELSFYIELEHPDFDEKPIGGHVFLRKGLEKQENPIYFRRTKLRLKHTPFEKLQTPKEFKEALEVSDEERKHYQEKDGELDQDLNSLKAKAEEILARNEAIIEKTYEEEMKKANEQLQQATTNKEKDEIKKKIDKIENDREAKVKRHNKQTVDLKDIVNNKNTKKLKNFINKRAGADYAEWVVSLALLRHAPHLYHQRINADGVFKEDGIRSGKGSDPDFIITLKDKKRMIVEVKNYAYSSALNLTDQISYQLKCVRLYGMDYAIACNKSTEITDHGKNYKSVFKEPNNQAKAKTKEEKEYSINFNKKRFKEPENQTKEEAENLLKDEEKGLRSALIRMYKEALNGGPSWVFIKRLNFRSNLGKINGEDFNLDKHFVNFYANLHSQDRKEISADFQVILEP
ncbi:hypothetical protein ACT6CY_08980 [Campylobacter jejuni]|uniref:hypothetical protein n=1 Tax=Campylobacter jejuni TaxID=197 RepID=UPI0002581181|nr:hypothetical protein [Campylobacter jejuni]ASE86697.1 hypothetical protein A6J90_06345 [Campylobacter jejuni]AZU50747.1 hypothetical protein B1780_03395 [Campylobacter jejuni subsp. jejuni]EAI4438490.1 hypothetical protein [Campylobacter jejuni]EAI4550264.1 hypothetical protein [Campylobacter jejuni]EAL4814449.1 hypothetical protein [Campylobacter jejuni]